MRASGLSWDVMLKITKIELELIPDPDMYIFFQKGKRGGIPIFLIDTAKPTISIWNLMTRNKNQNILYNYTRKQFIWFCNVQISSNKWI